MATQASSLTSQFNYASKEYINNLFLGSSVVNIIGLDILEKLPCESTALLKPQKASHGYFYVYPENMRASAVIGSMSSDESSLAFIAILVKRTTTWLNHNLASKIETYVEFFFQRTSLPGHFVASVTNPTFSRNRKNPNSWHHVDSSVYSCAGMKEENWRDVRKLLVGMPIESESCGVKVTTCITSVASLNDEIPTDNANRLVSMSSMITVANVEPANIQDASVQDVGIQDATVRNEATIDKSLITNVNREQQSGNQVVKTLTKSELLQEVGKISFGASLTRAQYNALFSIR